MALPQTPGSTCSPGKASPDTGWPWKGKCHFKLTNASCHCFWARPKPWSEPSLGLGETKCKPRMKCGTSSLSCSILMFPTRHWLAQLDTNCRWFAVLHNTRQHFQFLCTCSTVHYCLMPRVPGPAAKGIRHSQEPQHPPPAGRQNPRTQ